MNTDVVREIQHALRTISFSLPIIPRIEVNGRYGTETKRAVEIFQSLFDLPPTGEVDSVTWDRLLDVYKDYENIPPRSLSVFPHRQFRLRIGDTHSSVPIIKNILNTVASDYENLFEVGGGNIYDQKTAQAIRILKNLHDLEDNEFVDLAVWELLVSLYEHTLQAGGSDTV